jgi:hypothetical protein
MEQEEITTDAAQNDRTCQIVSLNAGTGVLAADDRIGFPE